MSTEQQPLRVGSILVIGVVSVALLLATVYVTEAYYHKALDADIAAKREQYAPTTARDLKVQQQSALGEYRWVDRQKGVVQIPIDRAMELVVRDLRAGRPASGQGGS